MSEPVQEPKIRSVRFNAIMNTIMTTSNFLFPLITVPYVSRVLGPANNGIISWAVTLVGYFVLVARLGFDMYGTRECAKWRDDREGLSKVVQELLTIMVTSTIIVYIAYIIFVLSVPRTREYLPLMIIVSALIPLSTCGAEWFYRGIEQYGYITVRNIAFKIASIVLMFIFVREPSDYLIYAAITVIASAGSGILNILRLRSFVTFSLKRELNIRQHLRPMFTFSISAVASGMYSSVDMLLLGFLGTNFALGLYQLVSKIRTLCTALTGSVTDVMLPRLSYHEREGSDEDGSARLVGKTFNFIFILGLAVISALLICADPIIMLLGGQDYLGGSTALRLIAPLVLLGALGSMQSQYMVASNKERAYAATTVTGLILAIALELLFIPFWGINGAAVGLTLTELSVFVIRSFILRDFLRTVHKHTDYGKIFLGWFVAFVGAATCGYFLSQQNAFIQIIADAVVFVAIDGGILLLTRESFVHDLISRSR